MKLIKKLDKRRWKLPNGKDKTATFGLFECDICHTQEERTLTSGNNANTCGKKECIQTLRRQNQEKTFNSIIGKNGNYKKSPFYRTFKRVYDGIKQRCYNQNQKNYKYYGGKGIKICDRWLIFDNFVEDMFPEYERLKNNSKTLKTSPSIDRKDKFKDYEPDNCSWIKYGENAAKDKRIPIVQMDMENNILKTYNSMTDAANKIKFVPFGSRMIKVEVSAIRRCCTGEFKNHAGYNWAYATNKITLNI